ncbi:zinc finger SWIM domain-containing protein 8 homolog isoform X2 [Drosophila bipectinata]|uniref:zinc finger SWIM domain-containing protein 8 homolog isoform X2 n=1 Tax=Drosophila bipectinata TaxID=42026 RepID=UPI001C892A7A|nr:zinc finger SWIM domain-containing protein 8 homolog isoform X2 [Drosophila bipectinata]
MDRFSFDDSIRFEEDSLCSWSSEPESLCNNWRGWKKPSNAAGSGAGSASGGGLGGANGLGIGGAGGGPSYGSTGGNGVPGSGANGSCTPGGVGGANGSSAAMSSVSTCGRYCVSTLAELAARCVASYIPFELVEHVYPPVPEQLQLRIAFWSFPDNEEDIRLYSCLANSSADEFNRGDQLFRLRAVKDPLQIGFHLSASVVNQSPRVYFNVAVTFDRRRISSCNCTCTSSAYWCSHVVAVCLHRIHCPQEVCLRAPVSESLTRLQRDQLQKFAQYLISELPQQILPTAQRLLDELLSAQPTAINTVCGAPDPTAGASINDQTSWYLDEKTLHNNIKRILIKFCLPAPIVFSDVNYLTNSAPPAAAEWSSLLRPLRGREPEGMWNLLSIVREMYRRCDRNAVRLLEIITEECMSCDQILTWWFQTKLTLMMGSHGHSGGKHSNTHSNSTALQHACSSLCDEIVALWRLAALNPGLAPDERDMLHAQFTAWHLKILDRVVKSRMMPPSYTNKHQQNSRSETELFIGFKPAIEACYLDWEDYPIPGVTHTHDTNPIYYSPFTCFKHTDLNNPGQLNATQALMKNNKHYNYFSSSSDHGLHAGAFNQRMERPFLVSRYLLGGGDMDPMGALPAGANGGASSMGRQFSVAVLGAGGQQMGGSGVAVGGGGGGAASGDANPSQKQQQQKAAGSSSKGAGAVGAAAGDGNRSSASSEGFCENDDFGGDTSSSHNYCLPGQASVPGQKSALTESDSQSSFDAVSQQSKDDPPAGGQEQACSTSDTSSASSASLSASTASGSSNSSTSSMLMAGQEAVGGVSVTQQAPRRLSKDESFSSSSDEFNHATSAVGRSAAGGAAPGVGGAGTEAGGSSSPAGGAADGSAGSTAGGDVTPVPSTSAAARAALAASSSTSAAPTPHAAEGLGAPVDQPSTSSVAAQRAAAHQNAVASDKPHVFSNVRPTEDAWDILLARAEGLHAHGHGREACILAVRLAEQMLANPPNLLLELPPAPKRKGKKQNVNPISHQLTVVASATLSKCAFLCTVLSENSEHYHIGFRICLFALEMPRPPASTKPLEVKLANQEADILALLKRLPLGSAELQVIRERAEQLRSGTFKTRGEALLPINLATFIFDALVTFSSAGGSSNVNLGAGGAGVATGGAGRSGLVPSGPRLLMYKHNDENLGFDAAVAALGLKANVSEAEHPLLCEGTRRQRGDLALTLLYHYKDEPRKIAKIMEKLLDRDIHTLLKAPLLPAYYSSNPPVRTPSNQPMRREDHEYGGGGGCASTGCNPMANLCELLPTDYGSVGGNSRPHSSTSAELELSMCALSMASSQSGMVPTAGTAGGGATTASSASTSGNPSGTAGGNGGNGGGGAGGSAGGGGAGGGNGGASATGGGSTSSSRSKESRYKGKRAYPSIPNQPSEASAHFMFELAKNVLTKAGGNSSTSLFTQASTNQNHHGPHRALHMCAFQLGLYALGLHNCVSPNWLSRTYSSHVSWILGQAMEIGAPAISFLIDTWEAHLTPPEAAGMADRASRGWDNNMVYPAAELALSVLPHAAALNPNEIQRAILQCKEQSDLMLERACLTVETAAKGGGVYPEVLFQVARYWYELYMRNTPNNTDHEPHDDGLDHSAVSLSALIESQQQHELQQQQQQQQQQAVQQQQQQQVVQQQQQQMGLGNPVGVPGGGGVGGGPPVAVPPSVGNPQAQFQLAPIGLAPYPPYSFCQGLYAHHAHNLSYPPGQMQMYISAGPPPPSQAYAGYQQGPPPQQQPPNPQQQQVQVQQVQQQQQQQVQVQVQQQQQQPVVQQQVPIAGHAPPGHPGQPPAGFQPQPPPPGPFQKMSSYFQALPPQAYQALQAGPPGPPMGPPGYYGPPPPPPPNGPPVGVGVGVGVGVMPMRQHHNQHQHPVYSFMQQAPPPPPQQQQQAPPSQPPVRQRQPHQFTQTQLRYLLAAYNVGMLAMETLARRVHDDRPQAKYARNPPYGEDVKWLLRISKKLGTQYLHQFCICAVNSIVSPFVLHDVAIESAHYLGRNNHQLVMQHLRSALTPLVQKCQQMYIQCIHQKLYHLTQGDYEEFASIVVAARAAFQITPEGSAQFKDWLQSIKRSKSCKKELWTQINAALQSNSK